MWPIPLWAPICLAFALACTPSPAPAGDPRVVAGLQEFDRSIFIDGAEFRVTDPKYLSAGQHPSVAALASLNSGQVFCSGVLIDRNTVLTAAHCFCEDSAIEVSFGESVQNAAIVRTVSAVRLQNGATCTSSASRRGHDLALLTLTRPVTEAPYSAFARLSPTQPVDATITRRFVLVAGFGATAPGAAPDGRKAATVVPLISSECRDPLDAQLGYDCVPGRDLLAIAGPNPDGSPRPDSCNGDSGGPAFVRTTNNALVVAAIVSRGIRPNAACGEGGVYTLVTPAIVEAIRREPPQ